MKIFKSKAKKRELIVQVIEYVISFIGIMICLYVICGLFSLSFKILGIE